MSQPWIPKGYQKRAIKFCIRQGAAGLFLDPGLGKSSVMLATIKLLLKQKLIRSVLIAAPLRVCYSVWPEEIKKWSDFNELRCEVLHGAIKNLAVKKEADIYLINPEGLEWLSTQKLDCDMLVVDESTLFKHPNTKRFKLLKAMLPKFRRRYILTGTPAPNGYMDLFGQVFILDLGNALGRFITHYRMKFFYQTGYGGYEWKLIPGKDREIERVLKPLVLRMEAADYLDLPELIYNSVKVPLPPAAGRVYKDVEEDFIAMLNAEDKLVISNAASASSKCRQIANGAVYMDDHSWREVHSAKLDALRDLVEEASGQPVLVVYEFQHDLERLLAAFGENTPYIGGGVTPKRSSEIQEAWNRGELPLLFGHPRSMGHGLNLQKGGHILVWFTPTWDLELYEQTNRRLHRQGTEHAVIVHHLIAEGTVDEIVMKTLEGKDKTQRQLLEALKHYAASQDKRDRAGGALPPVRGTGADSGVLPTVADAVVQQTQHGGKRRTVPNRRGGAAQ